MVTTMTDTDELLAQVAELRHQVAELATAKPTTAGPRFKPEFNTVYQAPVTGYLAVYFTGGRTGETRLLVGETNPPTECVGRAAGTNSTYCGTVVRAGEIFMVDTRGKRPAFECLFTPLF
jgi:hypothetical protein